MSVNNSKTFISIIISIIFLNQIYSQCQTSNCKDGFGVYYFSNGDVYRGNWVNDQRTGYGEYFWTNGNLYKGNFLNGLWHGEGTTIFSNGDVEVAIFENGKLINQLSYLYSNQKTGGCVIGNCQNGFGKYIYTNGVYEGNFINGKWEGKGIHIAPNGDKYEGEFLNSKRNGYGVFVWAKGTKYEGNWIDGKVEGQGTYHYLDGSWYTGNFSNYIRTGYGEYHYANGSLYKGQWYNGQRHGVGVHEYTDLTIEDGMFENGKFIGTKTSKTLNSTVNNSTTNKSTTTTNTISTTNTQTCAYKFSKPTNLTYKFVDNRDYCCRCKTERALYEKNKNDNYKNEQSIYYIGEKLYLHFDQVNADENHRKADIDRMREFLNANYPGFLNGYIITGASLMAELGYLNDLSSLFNKKDALVYGSTVRKVDLYGSKLNKFCSPYCEEKCDYESNCKCY
jgi:hypothetical protein